MNRNYFLILIFLLLKTQSLSAQTQLDLAELYNRSIQSYFDSTKNFTYKIVLDTLHNRLASSYGNAQFLYFVDNNEALHSMDKELEMIFRIENEVIHLDTIDVIIGQWTGIKQVKTSKKGKIRSVKYQVEQPCGGVNMLYLPTYRFILRNNKIESIFTSHDIMEQLKN